MPGTVNCDEHGKPMRDDPKYLKIVEETQEQLSVICSELALNPRHLDNLLLAAEEPDEQTWSMIDGVLAWAGVSDIDEGRNTYWKKINGFIVPNPGNRGVAPLLLDKENQKALIYSALYDSDDDPTCLASANWEPLQLMATTEQLGERMVWMHVSSQSDALWEDEDEDEFDGFDDDEDDDGEDKSEDDEEEDGEEDETQQRQQQGPFTRAP